MKFCLLLISYTVLSPLVLVFRVLLLMLSLEMNRLILLLMKIFPPILVVSVLEANFSENSKHYSSYSFLKEGGTI